MNRKRIKALALSGLLLATWAVFASGPETRAAESPRPGRGRTPALPAPAGPALPSNARAAIAAPGIPGGRA